MGNFWGRRLIALIVDIIILTLFMWILSGIVFWITASMGIFSTLTYWIFIGAIIILAYFTYFEGKTGKTPGKRMFNLKVVAEDGNLTYKKSLIRSLSKILYLPLILDLILGFIFVKSNDRFLDRVSGTRVVPSDHETQQKNDLTRVE
ncbi:MAG: RDD family protein [Methanobacterium sp.]|nr:RDD family protein [Methanobacterium sp.]